MCGAYVTNLVFLADTEGRLIYFHDVTPVICQPMKTFIWLFRPQLTLSVSYN